MGKVISITNQKGGVGKTTTAVNLASVLGEYGKKVLLIDIDSQGNATQGIGIDKQDIEKNKKTSYDLFLDNSNDANKYITKTAYENLSIIGSSQNLASFDNDYHGDMRKEMILKNKIKKIRNDFDYIIIDNPPAIGTLTLNGLVASDSVIIPVQSEFYALEGMTQLLQSVQLCKKHLNRKLKIEGILISMYIVNTNLSEAVKKEVEKYFGKYVFKTYIRRNVAVAEAPSYGEPINYYSKKSAGAQDFYALAKEVLNNG